MSEEENVIRYDDTQGEDSEGEEALSLRDLPLQLEGDECNNTFPQVEGEDLFEFFTDVNAEKMTMHSAEDIIFCGKLLPYKSPPRKNHLHRKSESLNALQRSQSSAKSRFMRSNNSLDYRKLHRDSSIPKMTRTTTDDKISGGFDVSLRSSGTQPKPKWRLLMFGAMKPPTEMELKDIRNRQNRLIRSTWLPTSHAVEMVSVKKEEAKGSWRLLRALSCKGEATDVITASFRCIPHV